MSKFLEINTITFCPDTYENNLNSMWNDISTTLQILLKNNNICTINQEDFGIVVIKYDHDETVGDTPYGVPNPLWVTWEEEEKIMLEREKTEEEN